MLIVQTATAYVDTDINHIVISVLLLNSLVNPIIHVTVRKPVRKAYLEVFSWIFCSCPTLKLPATEQLGMYLYLPFQECVTPSAKLFHTN